MQKLFLGLLLLNILRAENVPTTKTESYQLKMLNLESQSGLHNLRKPIKTLPSLELEYENTDDHEIKAELGYSFGSRRRNKLKKAKQNLEYQKALITYQANNQKSLIDLQIKFVESYTLQEKYFELNTFVKALAEVTEKVVKQAESGQIANLDKRRILQKYNLFQLKLNEVFQAYKLSLLTYQKALGYQLKANLSIEPSFKLNTINNASSQKEKVLSLEKKILLYEKQIQEVEFGSMPEVSLGLAKEKDNNAKAFLKLGFSFKSSANQRHSQESYRKELLLLELAEEQVKFEKGFINKEIQKLYLDSYKLLLNSFNETLPEAKKLVNDSKLAWFSGQISLTDWFDSLEMLEETIHEVFANLEATLLLELKLKPVKEIK